ncbi:2873_t:CDS:2 [Acaulospora morrowiae]|uniref:2873_t:CDS:1 n=1 Tax=Acaulospora morrowiae TaxID=94023 RepID=A0A9N8WKD2_9GLOM|nr:2873_t:CDS:2 [Acaulospora morrowiae]
MSLPVKHMSKSSQGSLSSEDSAVSPLQSVYMTPQDSTCNLLISAIKQATTTNHLETGYRTDELNTSPTSTPFFTTPSTPFGPFRQTMDLSNVPDYYINMPNAIKPAAKQSVNAAAVSAKIREYESLIKKASLNNLNTIVETTEVPKYNEPLRSQKSESPRTSISESRNRNQAIESQKQNHAKPLPNYNHTIAPSSGSNTFVADSYDHIEVGSVANSMTGSSMDQTDNLVKRMDDGTVLMTHEYKPERWTDDFSRKEYPRSSASSINPSHKRSSSKDAIVEEATNASRRISRMPYMTRGDIIPKSDNAMEAGGIDSPISSRILVRDAIVFSPTPSKRSKESYIISDQEGQLVMINPRLRNKILLLIGICLVFFLVSLDANLVANQIPKIVIEFNAGENISWIVISYSLSSAIVQPLCGKFSGVVGKKILLLVAIFIFGLGSALCGAAQSIQWLICTRVLAGLGGGVIIFMAPNVISDVMPMHQRTLFNNILYATFALGLILGPIVGGSFAEYLSWRWSFYMNGPLSIISIVILLLLLRVPILTGSMHTNLKRVDWLGILLLISGSLLIILPLSYGGNKSTWLSPPIIGMSVSGLLILVTFVILEVKFAAEPVIPGFFFNDSCLRAVFGAFFFMGWVQVAVCYFTPIYLQNALGFTAVASAVALLPLVISIIASMGLGNMMILYTGRYRWLIYIGSLLLIAGSALLSTYTLDTGGIMRTISLIVVGLGIGSLSNLSTPAQAAVKGREKRIITGLCNFFRGSGWTFGMAVSGALFNNEILLHIQNLPTVTLNDTLLPEKLSHLLSSDRNAVLSYITDAISKNFELCIVISIIVLVFSLFIEHYELKEEDRGIGIANVEMLNEK